MASNEQSKADQARVALAEQMRRGMHLLVAREPSTAVLDELTASLTAHFDQLDEATTRVRDPERFDPPSTIEAPADGDAFPDSLDRPISGTGNPFGTSMIVFRDGDAVTTTISLDAGFEGAPGRSHGGFVSAIFDDLFGSIPMLHGKIAFTASLTVNYVAPSPVHERVTYRGWVDRIEGKKIYVAGESHHGDTLVSTASALFIDASAFFAERLGTSQHNSAES